MTSVGEPASRKILKVKETERALLTQTPHLCTSLPWAFQRPGLERDRARPRRPVLPLESEGTALPLTRQVATHNPGSRRGQRAEGQAVWPCVSQGSPGGTSGINELPFHVFLPPIFSSEKDVSPRTCGEREIAKDFLRSAYDMGCVSPSWLSPFGEEKG